MIRIHICEDILSHLCGSKVLPLNPSGEGTLSFLSVLGFWHNRSLIQIGSLWSCSYQHLCVCSRVLDVLLVASYTTPLTFEKAKLGKQGSSNLSAQKHLVLYCHTLQVKYFWFALVNLHRPVSTTCSCASPDFQALAKLVKLKQCQIIFIFRCSGGERAQTQESRNRKEGNSAKKKIHSPPWDSSKLLFRVSDSNPGEKLNNPKGNLDDSRGGGERKGLCLFKWNFRVFLTLASLMFPHVPVTFTLVHETSKRCRASGQWSPTSSGVGLIPHRQLCFPRSARTC